MRYLLDTNVCIKFLNGEPEQLRQRFLRTDRQDIAVCSVHPWSGSDLVK